METTRLTRKEKKMKLVNKGGSGNVTAVAGVRGADVDNQKEKVDVEKVKWKE